MAFKGPFEDRLAIRELIDSYSDAVTQRDADAWGANWTEDSRWCLPDLGVPAWTEILGKAKIVAEWIKMMGDFHGEEGDPAVCSFICTPGAMEVSGDAATARSYSSEVFIDERGRTLETKGQYDDKFVKLDGQWFFKERVRTLYPIADHAEIRAPQA